MQCNAVFGEVTGRDPNAQDLAHLRRGVGFDPMQLIDGVVLRVHLPLYPGQRLRHQMSLPFGVPNHLEIVRRFGRIFEGGGKFTLSKAPTPSSPWCGG